MRGRGGWRGGRIKLSLAVMDGLTSERAGGGGHGASWILSLTCRAVRVALKLDAI